MGMRILTNTEVRSRAVAQLGLDSTILDLTSVEAIAAAFRRSASFLCPCAPATLIRAVVEPMRGLVDDSTSTSVLAQETIESMIAIGDFLEHSDIEEDTVHGTAKLIYAVPASFVPRENGSLILLGIPSFHLPGVPGGLAERIEYTGYLRRLSPVQGEDLGTELKQLGFIEVFSDRWLQVPRRVSAAQHLARMDHLLTSAQPSGDVPGLSLLEPEAPVLYYRGRWASSRSQTGRFIARRAQAYGADLWCYIEMRNGRPLRLVDLPVAHSRWRGSDEAWHVQMAIDAQRGQAQRLRVVTGPGGTSEIQFFSPVPMWAQRRWDAIGEKVNASGCLFAYRLAEADLAEELRFARDMLWLEHLD